MRAFQPIQTYADIVSRVIRVLLVGLVIGISSSLCALGMVWLINTGSQWIVETKNNYSGFVTSLMTISIPMLGGLIVGHIVQHMTDKRPHNPADVILAAQSNLSLASLKLKDGLLNFAASIISLVCGASLGQYGPIVNMGATLSANLHKIVRTDLTILIGCGVAAAISSAFNAPIAGVIFAHEVILRHYSLRAFAPITISASVGFYISKFIFNFEPLFEIQSVQILFLSEFAGFTVIGILAGLLAVFYLRSILYAKLLSNKIPLAQKYKPMIAGLIIGLLALQIPEILGIGENVLRMTLHAPAESIFSISLLLVAKFTASAICLGFGFAGGVFSPALLIGVLFGSLFGIGIEQLFPYSNIAIYAVCGMAAVTSPIIGAPLTTILIIFELTHSYELTTAVMISVVFSNVVAYRLFGCSLFDFQLKNRGYDLSHGRDPLILSTISIGGIVRQAYTHLSPDTSISDAITLLSEADTNQAFVLGKDKQFIGCIKLVRLVRHIKHPNRKLIDIEDIVNPHCLRFSASTSVWEGMRDIKGFVGERVPIVDDDNKLIGIIYEADLIHVYLDTVKKLRDQETANT